MHVAAFARRMLSLDQVLLEEIYKLESFVKGPATGCGQSAVATGY